MQIQNIIEIENQLKKQNEKKQQLTKTAVLNSCGTAPFIEFPDLTAISFIKHGFSTKLGGVSKGIYKSMNLGFLRGDEEDKVRENYNRICRSIGIDEKDLVFTDQVHGTVVRRATKEDKGKGFLYPRDYQGVDGHITNEIGVPLIVFTADCVPLFFVDKKKHAIGAVHSGWRGTKEKIAKITVERMNEEFGSDCKDMIAVIGPSIGAECYEVSDDVAQEFKNNYSKEEIRQFLFAGKEKDKYQLDLWKANQIALLQAGIKKENIIISELCTMCHSELLFSHRATNGKRGSLAGFIQLIS